MKHLFLYALVPVVLSCCPSILAADRTNGNQPSAPGKQLKIDEGEKEMEARRKLIAAAFASPGASREDIESMANETFPVMEKLAQSEVKSPYCQWVLATWRKGQHAKVLAEGEKRLIAHPVEMVALDADGYFGSDEAPEKIDPTDTKNLGDPFGFVPTANQRETNSI